MPDGRDGRDGRDALGQVVRVWPLVVALAGVIGAAYVARSDLADHSLRIRSLEAAADENTAAHREIQATTRGSDQRLEGIQAQLRRQAESLERVSLRLERICAVTKGCAPSP